MKRLLLVSLLPLIITAVSAQSPIGTVIGTTTYDLQSNSSGPKRLIQGPGGTLQALWTGSTELTGAGWLDRGTFYNYFNGTAWGPQPSSRLESIRTGWPTGAITANGKEVIISHDVGIGNWYLIQLTRPVAGTGAWTQTTPGLAGTWPRIVLSGAAGTSLIGINTDNDGSGGGTDYTQYFRSTDEGTSWSAPAIFPQMDSANGYSKIGADNYSMDSRGDVIAVVAGDGGRNHLTLWKSIDDGVSWTRTVIITHPIPNYDGNSFIDLDGDDTADVFTMHDGDMCVLLDNNDIAHVWSGVMNYLDDDSTDGAWSYFPRTDSLYYWNENMGTDSVETITQVIDLDGDGTLNGIGQSIATYFRSLSSFPSAAIDTATGNIYLVYSAVVEFSDYFDDPSDALSQSFRDLYGMYTADGGANWSVPENLTNSADINNGSAHYESIFPSVARYADGKVHVMWQRDEEPGLNLQGDLDPITINDIVYHAFDYSDFEPGPPTAGFSSNKVSLCKGDAVQFLSDTNDVTSWLWSFPGGTPNSSTLSDPTIAYDTVGVHDVTLIVTNAQGSDTLVKTAFINCTTGIGQASSPSISIDSITDQPCGGTNGEIYLTSSGGIMPYSFNWSTGDMTEDIIGLAVGTYMVTVTGADKCYSIKSAEVTLTLPPVQEICLVTVDSIGQANEIVWEKVISSAIDSFRIHRRALDGTYKHIGSVHYDSLSLYRDDEVNPNNTYYRYKISSVDSCGFESALGNFHETMFLQIGIGTNNNINLDWQFYTGFAVSFYRILRDITGNGNFQLIDSVTNTTQKYTDLNVTFDSVDYVIDVVHPQGCVATRSHSYTSARSNPVSAKVTSIIDPQAIRDIVKIRPNPNFGVFNVQVTCRSDEQISLRVMNIHGQMLISKQVSPSRGLVESEFDLSGFGKGFYLLEVQTSTSLISRKIMVL